MSVYEAATYLLQYGITPAAIIGAVAWLFKAIVINALQRERVVLTGQVQHDSALAIERVRSISQKEIEQAKHAYTQALEEKKTRFAILQDKRLEPILQMHLVLVELVDKVEHLQTILEYEIDNDVSDDLEKIITILRSANLEFAKTRIFLPDSLASSIERLITDIRNAEQAYYVARINGAQDPISHLKARLKDEYRKSMANISDRISVLLGVEKTE